MKITVKVSFEFNVLFIDSIITKQSIFDGIIPENGNRVHKNDQVAVILRSTAKSNVSITDRPLSLKYSMKR